MGLFFFLFGGMAAIGAFLIGLSIRNWMRGAASGSWPTAQGRILRSFVLVQKDRSRQSFTPQVEYEYFVEGVVYRATRLRYGQSGTWTRAQSERSIAPYPAGGQAPVFFNPAHPADAVLRRGTSWGNAGVALAGCVFLGVALSVLMCGK
jgi:hypothetical protein